MRNMSFALTTEQVRNQTKTVTRRFGWWFLIPGDVVQPILKSMGLKKGEKIQRIGPPIRILSTRCEMVSDVTEAEIILEGFPKMKRFNFMLLLTDNFRKAAECTPVNRIEFEYLNGSDDRKEETR